MSVSHVDQPNGLRPVRTAKTDQTIWSTVTEHDFRQNLVTLERRTNAVPIDVLTASVVDDGPSEKDILPLSVERSLADDLAYLAAVTEGAQSVAAVCLEQHVGMKLVVRVAGMDVVDEKVRGMLTGIALMLERKAVHGESEEDLCTTEDATFTMIIEQHSQKLLGRMRSTRWVKPTYLRKTHKKPLYKDFENVAHRIQHIYPKKGEWKTRKILMALVHAMAKEFENFEFSSVSDRVEELKRLVKATYDFCKVPDIVAFASTVASVTDPTPQVAAAVKTFRQLEKIGAYWRIAKDLNAIAMRYPATFQRVELEYVVPYADVTTDIAYESWANTMHVHAEIQLVVEYAVRQQSSRDLPDTTSNGECNRIIWPRTIGTSKYLCYLCYLFLREHGGFGQALSSHGRLFDQWTVPDLQEFNSETRKKFEDVLCSVNESVERQTEALPKDVIWRAEPMTSRQNLLGTAREDAGVAEDMLTLEEKMSAI